MDEIKNLTAEEIKALSPEEIEQADKEHADKWAETLKEVQSAKVPDPAKVAELEVIGANRDLIEADNDRREAEAAEVAAKVTELAERKFGKDKAEAEEGPEDGDGEEGGDEDGEESDAEPEVDQNVAEPVVEAPAVEATPAVAAATKAPAQVKAQVKTTGGVRKLASRTKAPEVPEGRQLKPVSITASAGNPNAAPSEVLTLAQVGGLVLDHADSYPVPDGDGKTEDIRKSGTAKFAIHFDDDIMVDSMENAEQAEAAIKIATDESRLPGGSLVAAAGWCAPSETVYDLDQDATSEGMLSLPEIGVRRGGIRYPVRPEFADFYAAPGFKKTEAEVAAGSAKTCVTIPCPSFVDVRLDVDGVCIKVDILAERGYPENVANYVSGTLVAHEHWINADVIGRVQTAAGAARVITGLGDTATDLLEGLILVIDQRRQIHRLSFTHTMEVLLPFWVKNMLKADLARRTGRPAVAVQDAEITAIFAAAGANVQWLYDWQGLTTTDEAYPATFNAIVYPAGTFVKGTAPVINLNTVYDAASLATNTYTGLFTEQAYLVAKKKLGADLLTFPICNAGRTGINDLACA